MTPNFSSQMEEEPPVNRAINDLLAIAGGDEELEPTMLWAIMMLCSERLARLSGRKNCLTQLGAIEGFIREAQPSTPWKE